MMEAATGERAEMWGASIVGFGRYAYTNSTKKTFEWPLIGFSPRKQDLTLYLMPGFDGFAELMAKLGKHKTGKSCLYLMQLADVDIDVPAHKVTRQGEQISLTPLEFDLLVALARKPRQVFTRDVLLEQVWGYRHPADTRLVNVHVQRLRAKVEKDPENPQVVLTVRGVGYKAGPP